MIPRTGQVNPPAGRKGRPHYLIIHPAQRVERDHGRVVREAQPVADVSQAQRPWIVHQVPGHVRREQLDVALHGPVPLMKERVVVGDRAFRIRNLDAAVAADQCGALDERRHRVNRTRVHAEIQILHLDFHVVRNSVVIGVAAAVRSQADGRQGGAQRSVGGRRFIQIPVVRGNGRPHDAGADTRAVRTPVVLVRIRFVAGAVHVIAFGQAVAVLTQELLRVQQGVAIRIAPESVVAGGALRIQVVLHFPAVRQEVVIRVFVVGAGPLQAAKDGQIARDGA